MPRSSLCRVGLILATLFLLILALPSVGWTADVGALKPAVTPRGSSERVSRPGSQLWVSRYDGWASSDWATAAATSMDGSAVYVTGWSPGPSGQPVYATVAYDASTGTQLWASRYEREGHGGDPSAIGVNQSEVFVTGEYGARRDDYGTVAYDASTGAQLWARSYRGPHDNFSHSAESLAVGPDGATVFVTGQSGTFQGGGSKIRFGYATVAYDASTGKQLWMRQYNGPGSGNSRAEAIGASPDGSLVFVSGYSDGTLGSRYGSDYVTVAYDASTGVKRWVSRYAGSRWPNSAYVAALGVSPDGSKVFVTGGITTSKSAEHYATVAYDAATGAKLWVNHYVGPFNHQSGASGLAVSPGGSEVFVTGGSDGGKNSLDYATVAYDTSTGKQLWAKRYSGPGIGWDVASAIGVSPDGSQVFVTGRTEVSSGDADYATVAYDAATGAKLWVKRFNGPANGPDAANALTVSPDGSEVFVTGYSAGETSDYDYATVAYSLT